MNNSREKILARLEKSSGPNFVVDPIDEYQPVVTVDDVSPAALRELFIAKAEQLASVVHPVSDEADAIKDILRLIGDVNSVSAWDQDEIPIPGLYAALDEAGITISAHDDSNVEIGITGASAALAATGSLVLTSGPGQYRAPSILPPRHIAVLKASQIFASLESWLADQRESGLDAFRNSSNIVLISGPSRTADIAMELVMGMHGPKELHIILLP